MTRRNHDRLSARAERVADEYMSKHGGDWGYRIVSPDLIPKQSEVITISLPVEKDRSISNAKIQPRRRPT